MPKCLSAKSGVHWVSVRKLHSDTSRKNAMVSKISTRDDADRGEDRQQAAAEQHPVDERLAEPERRGAACGRSAAPAVGDSRAAPAPGAGRGNWNAGSGRVGSCAFGGHGYSASRFSSASMVTPTCEPLPSNTEPVTPRLNRDCTIL